MTETMEFVEVQSSGEEATFSETQMTAMLELCKKGIKELVELQYQAIRDAEGVAEPDQLQDLAKQFGS